MFRTIDTNDSIKYAGRSKAVVIDNRDPMDRGRIRVEHPILGPTVWIDYLMPTGIFSIPSIGDLVYVECDSGELEYPIAFGQVIKGTDDEPELRPEFRRDVPTNRGMSTPGGHLLEFDDGLVELTQDPQDTEFTTESKGIRITSSGNNKIHIVEEVDSGNTYILIEDAGGNFIKLDYENNELTINSLGKTKFDTAEDREDTVGGELKITVTGAANITADTATIEASEIKLGEAAAEAVVKGDAFKSFFDGHTHSAGMLMSPMGPVTGSSGGPDSPMPADTLSDKVKTE